MTLPPINQLLIKKYRIRASRPAPRTSRLALPSPPLYILRITDYGIRDFTVTLPSIKSSITSNKTFAYKNRAHTYPHLFTKCDSPIFRSNPDPTFH